MRTWSSPLAGRSHAARQARPGRSRAPGEAWTSARPPGASNPGRGSDSHHGNQPSPPVPAFLLSRTVVST